jgi:hypothetical protein
MFSPGDDNGRKRVDFDCRFWLRLLTVHRNSAAEGWV